MTGTAWIERVRRSRRADADHQHAQRRRRARRGHRWMMEHRPNFSLRACRSSPRPGTATSTTSTDSTSSRSTCRGPRRRGLGARGGGQRGRRHGMVCTGSRAGSGRRRGGSGAGRGVHGRRARSVQLRQSPGALDRRCAGWARAGRGVHAMLPTRQPVIPGVVLGVSVRVRGIPRRYRRLREGLGSIIVVVATDAPLLPHQLDRVARTRCARRRADGGKGRELIRRHLSRVLDGNGSSVNPGSRVGGHAPERRDRPDVLRDCSGHRGSDRQRAGGGQNDGRRRWLPDVANSPRTASAKSSASTAG